MQAKFILGRVLWERNLGQSTVPELSQSRGLFQIVSSQSVLSSDTVGAVSMLGVPGDTLSSSP